MSSHARRPAVVAALLMLIALVAAPAFAAEPTEVAREIRDDGVFVESGSDLSEATAGDLVATVRNEGERFSIVVLTDDPGSGAVTFGDAVVDRLGGSAGLIFVLTPDDLAVVGTGDVFTLDEIDDALDAAIDAGGSDTAYASNFVAALTGITVAVTPDPEPEPAATPATSPESSGGGGFGFIGFILIVGGALLLIFWLVKRSKQKDDLRTVNQLAAARAEIQSQIDAVANDLLDMEDEVRKANNDQVDDLYNTAGETYQEASDALAEADTPQEFLDIANDLETAIWQLDSAEALLDGKPVPPRPIPQRLEPVPAPEPAGSGGSGSGPLGVPPRPTRPTRPAGGYARRPTRRSSGMSPNLIEMLITLGAGALANRSRPAPAPRRTSRTASSRTSRSSGRSGGGFLPSPSRKGSSSSRSSRSTRSRSSSRSSRRGTGGRIRTGRKRRK